MIVDLFLASIMVILTVVIHFFGLAGLIWILSFSGHGSKVHGNLVLQCSLLIGVMLGLVGIHTVEIWLYALMFWMVGAVQGFEPALYYSTVTFSTLGYGDIVLSPTWRVMGAIEAANGLILFGWSTAFLISLMGRMRVLEHDWVVSRHHEKKPDQ